MAKIKKENRLTMNKVVKNAEKFVRRYFLKFYCPGHDWLHTQRVRNLVLFISKGFKINRPALEIAALFHDLGRAKSGPFHALISAKMVKDFLKALPIKRESINIIIKSVKEHEKMAEPTYLEGKILQDADKLDAMGAIGIIRNSEDASVKNVLEYDEENPFGKGYKKNLEKWIEKNIKEIPNKRLRINKFLIEEIIGKEMQWVNIMWTKKGKEMAKKRFNFMKNFLEELKNNLKEADVL